MQSLKIEFLNNYNSLLKSALKSSSEFPDHLCNFLINEYELDAAVLFKVDPESKLIVLGKAGSAKKSYTPKAEFTCETCNALKNFNSQIVPNNQNNCTIQASEFVQFENCIAIKVTESERALLKIAKKSPFTQNDKDNLSLIGNSLAVLLGIWMNMHGSVNTSVSEIVTNIAHELRTPTNSIMGFASLLNEENLTATQSEYVLTLKENAFNLLALINDLIDISKLDVGIKKESISTTNIKNFTEDIVKVFKEKVENGSIEFLVNVDKDIPKEYKIDGPILRYIFVNILTWSLRLTEKGRIAVSVNAAAKNRLNFRITDTSSGLTTKQLKDVFKPFALTDLGSNKIGNSTGLGLILAKRYVEELNGNFEITSSVGKGNIYNFTITAEPVIKTNIETQISMLPKPGQKNKILVIEDDYATSKLLSNYLNKWGYEPIIVNSAEQTRKILEKESFLAVLMDIILPDASGFELLKEMREHPSTKNTPVIICSVEAEQQKAFLMGAVEYFVKPVNYNYLVEVLTSYKLKKDSNILIVDDDVPTLNLMKEAVENLGFNPVAESHSGKVTAMIENMNLDLAIIDLDMPEINGFDLIKQIKSRPQFSKLPVIIYTGKENYQEELKKIDGLFEDLLEKNSTNIEDLSQTISQMINRYEEPSEPEELIEKTDVTKILLVEDYKHSQIIVTRLLKKNDFDSIVVVENGQEALDEVKKQKYDLILMDMQMPVMNGFEATERIRQLNEYKDTPIIALTAFAMKGDREKCLEAGATDYIPKPIDSQEFIEKVKYYTNSKVGQA